MVLIPISQPIAHNRLNLSSDLNPQLKSHGITPMPQEGYHLSKTSQGKHQWVSFISAKFLWADTHQSEEYDSMAYPAWFDTKGIRRVMTSEEEIAERAASGEFGLLQRITCSNCWLHWTNSHRPESKALATKLLSTARRVGSATETGCRSASSQSSRNIGGTSRSSFCEDVDDTCVCNWRE